MDNEASGHRPPSPPHSSDGDYTQAPTKIEHYRDLLTPPRTVGVTPHSDTTMSAYNSPSHYPPVPQHIYYSQQPTFLRPMPYHSPPVNMDAGIMTRNGKSLGSPMGSSTKRERASYSPRPRRNKNSKPGKKGVPVIDQPLSVLTENYKIPVRDMGIWVNRPAEERMQEVEKKKGYISRPMNSFMLYRSAYAERVKQFCKENNHQVVSQVTGQSWPLEPPEVRELYEQYAIVERDNHAAAHPNYKFAPNKSGRKRGREDDDSDSDGEWGGSRGTKHSRSGKRDGVRSTSSTPFDPDQAARYGVPMYAPPQPHPSSYQAANPHGPPPFSLGPGGLNHGYYHPENVPYGQHVDDVKFGRIDDPFLQYDPASQLIGMPDSHGGDLLGQTDLANPGFSIEQLVDPQLHQFDPSYAYGHFEGSSDATFQVPRGYGYGQYAAPEQSDQGGEVNHPGMATLTEGWTDSVQAGSDFDSEFQRWS